LNPNGDYVFTPLPEYSGDVPMITYTIQEPSDPASGEAGLTATAELQFTITPVADAPELKDPADTSTPEDTAIALGLTAPVVTDQIDHNGLGANGDNPELLGPITLTGIPAGVKPIADVAGTAEFVFTVVTSTNETKEANNGNEHSERDN